MTVTFLQLLIWLVIAFVIGVIGELIAGRRAPNGIIGATVLGFLAILLIVGVFHFHIQGEPILSDVPIVSAILAAVILVVLWGSIAYRRWAR